MQNELTGPINLAAAISAGIALLALLLRVFVPASDPSFANSNAAVEEVPYTAPSPVVQPSVQAPRIRVRNFALGDGIENDRLVGRIAPNSTLAEAQQVALRFTYSGDPQGSVMECLYQRQGDVEASTGTLALHNVNASAWCFFPITEPGRYDLRIKLGAEEIVATQVSLREPPEEQPVAEDPARQAGEPTVDGRSGTDNRYGELNDGEARVLCTVPGERGGPPRDIYTTLAECEAMAGLVNR